jgi:DNA repair exonuclease SbcCD ATPase subunit
MRIQPSLLRPFLSVICGLCLATQVSAQPVDEQAKLPERVEKLELAVFRDPMWPDRPLIVRVDKLEEKLEKYERAVRDLPREQRPAELDDRVDRLERAVKELSRDGGVEVLRRELARRDEQIATLERRLRTLEQRLAQDAGGDTLDRLARSVQRIEQSLNRLEDRVTRLENKR